MVQLRIYVSFRKAIRRLSYEEKGMLFDAMLAYADDKSLLPLEGKADAIWDFVQEMLDAQHNSYEEKCRNIEKGRALLLNKKSHMSTDETRMRLSSDEVNLSNDMSCHDQIQGQIQNQKKISYSQEKKRRVRDFKERSVSDEDFKDLFLDLGNGDAHANG